MLREKYKFMRFILSEKCSTHDNPVGYRLIEFSATAYASSHRVNVR